MEEKANEMYEKAIKESMRYLAIRDDTIIGPEREQANIMANYWLGYAAGLLQLIESTKDFF